LDSEVVDHKVWYARDRGGYELSVVARLKGPYVTNVQYKVRMENPKGDHVDYMLTLDGFKALGELLIALHDFCKDPIFTKEVQSIEKLKECLTAENITNWSKLSELQSEKTKRKS
jgi:hypothetical protein